MTAFLLAVHIVASIVFVGPVAVAASLFPRYARTAAAGGDPAEGAAAVAAVLHRISRVYAVAALLVPVFGVAVGAVMGVLGQVWVMASVVLTLVAAGLVGVAVVPGQRRVLAGLRNGAAASAAPVLSRLGMTAGLFNLTWVAVVVLMILRPGSTTGAGL